MPKYQVLRRLGLGAKKVGKNTVEGIMKRYAVTEEDGQEGRMHIKARARTAQRLPGKSALHVALAVQPPQKNLATYPGFSS